MLESAVESQMVHEEGLEMVELRHMNIKLAPEMHARAAQIAKQTGRPRSRFAFALIADYLKRNAASEWKILGSLERAYKDEYWGTKREIEEERKLPPYLYRADPTTQQKRIRTLQQAMSNEERLHMRAWAKYYGVTVDDLTEAAINEIAQFLRWQERPDLIGLPKEKK